MADLAKDPSQKPDAGVKKAVEKAAVVERVGMKRWLRLTARKHSAGKSGLNPAADAAAEALSQLLREPRRYA
jgi:hypothetical protein